MSQTFGELFSYNKLRKGKYPSHSTLNFSPIILLQDLEVMVGQVPAVFKQGTRLQEAIWVEGSRLTLKCSFGVTVPIAHSSPELEQKLKELSVETDTSA